MNNNSTAQIQQKKGRRQASNLNRPGAQSRQRSVGVKRTGTGWRIYGVVIGLPRWVPMSDKEIRPDTLTPMQKWLPRQLMC